MLEIEFNEDWWGGNHAKTRALLHDFMDDVADFAIRSLRKHVPVDTGRTYDHIHRGNVEKTPYGYKVEVGILPIEMLKKGESPDYPVFVHEGTGLFGEERHWIVPQHGNIMVFDVDGGPGNIDNGGHTVFTRNVEGQPAQPYMDTVTAETSDYIRLKKRELAAILNNS